MVYYHQGDYEKTLEYYNKALNILIELFGEIHPNIATTYSNIGYIYYNQGNYRKSLEYFRKALEIRTEIYPENHPAVKRTKENVEYIEAFINKSK